MKILSHRRPALPKPLFTSANGRAVSASKSQPITLVTGRLPCLQRADQDPWADQPPIELPEVAVPGLRSGNGHWLGGFAKGDTAEQGLTDIASVLGCRLRGIELDRSCLEALDSGFAHTVLWPLFHGQVGNCLFDEDSWNTYLAINQRFAEELDRVADRTGQLWIADHRLMLVARQLRKRGRIGQSMQLLLQMPVPAPDDFAYLPWRSQILDGLLAHDRILLQTDRDQRNLLAIIRDLAPSATVQGKRIRYGNRNIAIDVVPVGIPFDELAERADSDSVRALIVEQKYAAQHRRIILGIDPLDTSRGLIERCRVIERLFEQHPELAQQVLYIQVVQPTRHPTPAQRALKAELDREMGRVSGRFAVPTYSPIRYIHRALAPPIVSALYRSCDIALVAPLCDGVTRTALEFCASRVDEEGVLILSERSSAAQVLRDAALLVNPFDTTGAADILHRALAMPVAEQADRMRQARSAVQALSVKWLAETRRHALVQPASALPDRLSTPALQPTGSL